MSEEELPRNRFVLRTESGHPGYRNMVVLATASDLMTLSDEVRELSLKGSGRLDRYVTKEREPGSLGSIVFEVISEDTLCELQKGNWKDWFGRKFGCFILAAVCITAIYGSVCLITELIKRFL